MRFKDKEMERRAKVVTTRDPHKFSRNRAAKEAKRIAREKLYAEAVKEAGKRLEDGEIPTREFISKVYSTLAKLKRKGTKQ